MAKRRTKKQKVKAKHSIAIHWESDSTKVKSASKSGGSEASVKGQFKSQLKTNRNKAKRTKKPKLSDKEGGFSTIRNDILKSVILASIIIGLEMVLYLLLRS